MIYKLPVQNFSCDSNLVQLNDQNFVRFVNHANADYIFLAILFISTQLSLQFTISIDLMGVGTRRSLRKMTWPTKSINSLNKTQLKQNETKIEAKIILY